jgi:hypothetical protein
VVAREKNESSQPLVVVLAHLLDDSYVEKERRQSLLLGFPERRKLGLPVSLVVGDAGTQLVHVSPIEALADNACRRRFSGLQRRSAQEAHDIRRVIRRSERIARAFVAA